MKISLQTALVLTSIYILLPVILFLSWWTDVWIGTIVALVVGYVVWTQSYKVKKDFFLIPLKTIGIVGIALFLWTLLSGAGHRGLFNGDYYKHNALFNDLISLSWPVRYQVKETGDIVYLVYYFAYYLPSALIGKLWGWQAGNIALSAWTFTGVVFAFMWLFAFINNKKQLWYGLLFPLFSGLDGLGKLIMRTKVVNNEWEWWGRNWQYSGNTTLFFYVPQHALIGWLLMGMLLYMFTKNKTLPLQLLLLCASLLWSPFVTLGILPFYLLLFIRKEYSTSVAETAVSMVIIAVELLFFMSNMTFFVKDTAANGWLWDSEKLFGSWVLVRLILFYLFEFGVFVFFIFHSLFEKKRRTEFIVFFTALSLLFLFPWYKMGLMNDFAMRSSIPALYVVCYYWIRSLVETKKTQLLNFIMVSIFIIGALYPFILFSNGAIHFSFQSPRYALAHLESPVIRKQYLGYSHSLIFRLFNKTKVQAIMGSLSLQK